jgi:tRNA U34 5-methylaminomethyl-2-thiouridine-forming methyltransferase MnmC
MHQIQLLISNDGSHTIYLPELDETYHSRHGALTESKYVFIDAGLNFILNDQKEINVLEIGFGTGLNALLTLIWSEEKKIKTNYHTLEPFPLGDEIFRQLNYPEVIGRKEYADDFISMHKSENQNTFRDIFILKKYYQKLEDFVSPIRFDIIFYDAFAPSKQKEIWSLDNLKKSYSLLKAGGVLVTYCSSGQFKRDLKEAGFTLEVLPGPPGKKEMTRGKKML